MHTHIQHLIERCRRAWRCHSALVLAVLCGFAAGSLVTGLYAALTPAHEAVPFAGAPASGELRGAAEASPQGEAAVSPLHPASSSSSEMPAAAASAPMIAAPTQRTETTAPAPRSSVPVPSSASAGTMHSPSAPSAPSPEQPGGFPPLTRTVFPVSRVPDWGAMRTPAEWDRSYSQMEPKEFVSIPRYDLAVLTTPMAALSSDPDQHIPELTAKLFYSTRFFGTYDLDSGEFTGGHAGIDLKLAAGTPIGAIGGGRAVAAESGGPLGLHVVIEHRLRGDETVYSIYGHLGSVAVRVGQDVSPGQFIGTVGMTGNASAPHLHLQIDRKTGSGPHAIYPSTEAPVARSEADRFVVHPMTFISRYAHGE